MRDRNFSSRYEADYHRRIPFSFFCSVVIQELLLGCTHDLAMKRTQAFYRPFERVNRVVTPHARDWEAAGIGGMKIIRKYPSLKSKRFALVNDLLIALCCRRIGATLVTRNPKDFETVSSVVPIKYEVWA